MGHFSHRHNVNVGVMKVGEIYVYFWELSMGISYHFSDCIILTYDYRYEYFASMEQVHYYLLLWERVCASIG